MALNVSMGQTVTIKAINIKGNECSMISSYSSTIMYRKPTITQDGTTYTVTCPDEGATLYYTTYRLNSSASGWIIRESNRACQSGTLIIYTSGNTFVTSEGYSRSGNTEFKIEAYAADASGNYQSDTLIYKTRNV